MHSISSKVILVFSFLLWRARAQQVLTSPCSDVFEYESISSNNDEWHGVLHLRSNVMLHGIFIDIILDARARSLGANYRFSITTVDNMEYRLDDRTYKLRPGEQTDVRFFIKYTYTLPRVTEVRLNGQKICPVQSATTTQRSVGDRARDEALYYEVFGPNYQNTGLHNNQDRGINVDQPVTTRSQFSNSDAIYSSNSNRDRNQPSVTRSTSSHTTSSTPYYTATSLSGTSGNSNTRRDSQSRSVSTNTGHDNVNYENSRTGTNRQSNVHDNVNYENSRTGTNRPTNVHDNVNYEPSRTGTTRPSSTYDSVNYEPVRSGTTRPTNNRNTNNFGETTTRRPVFNSSPNDQYDYNQGVRTTTETYGVARNRDTSFRAANARTTTRSPYFQGDLAKFNPSERDTTPTLSFDTCGEIARKKNPLIVSGEESYRGQFPWHAALYISSGPQLKYTCGGSLINKKTILTAAHCVALKDSTRPMQPAQLLIYLGKYSLLQWHGPEQDVKVSEIIIHPNYDNEKFFSDLAIVKLKTEARFSEYVRPVCLWGFNKELRGIVNKIGRVPGFGYNEYGIVDDKLSYVNMPVVTHETCIWSNRDFFSRITSNVTYCAGFKNGSSVCNGDSGGGMVFKENNKWYLRGIVSVSIALQNHFLCDPDHYAVFTDVAQFIDWINDLL
ncbi:serine proteinase stubble-like [Phlebotomus papatasi]|uniref:serine proteinase stubble-like n=1 Tax=Phlebotomus papatasi TaxID=29031 RepID=UPI0024836FB3|nr:serine proteinase stubble-like [Phlebotomus papatasi]